MKAKLIKISVVVLLLSSLIIPQVFLARTSDQVLANPNPAWEFEAPLPFTPVSAPYFSQIFLYEGDQYVYIIDRGKNFYVYNLTDRTYFKKAEPTYTGYECYRNLAFSPDGTNIATVSDSQRRIEIYDIATNSWDASPQTPTYLGGGTSNLKALVWEDDDTIWVWARRDFYNRGKIFKYVVSTKMFTQYTNDTGLVDAFQGRSASYHNGVIYGGHIGSYDHGPDAPVCKYNIATGNYTFLYRRGFQYVYTHDRDKLWYAKIEPSTPGEPYGTYKLGYFDITSETYHDDVIPENPDRVYWPHQIGVSDDTENVIAWASPDPPELMSWGMPHADFTWLPEKPEPSANITFDASSSYSTGGNIASYDWDFGDNATGENVTVTHYYEIIGDYTVNLTVTDDTGYARSTSKVVSVRHWSMFETYAPVLYLHNDELFHPREITSILNESDLKNGEVITGPVTIDDLAAHDEANYYLDMWDATPDHLCLEWLPPNLQICADVPDSNRFEGYPYVIYGREKESEVYYVFQYWFFYPYNNWEPLISELGNNHEGDWEMMTVVLDKETGEPQWLTCTQHLEGKKYDWEDMETISGTHPKIYIAKGSHSSWGDNGIVGVHLILIANDVTSESGPALYPVGVDPAVVEATDKAPYALFLADDDQEWIAWEGLWGELSIFPLSNGPMSPGKQGRKWDDPLGWSQDPTLLSSIQALSGSPVNLHAYDQYGNHVGITEAGEIEAEIPGTYIYAPSADGEEFMWIYTEEELRFEIQATGAGEFDFDIGRYIKSEDKVVVVEYEDVLITENTTATLEVSPDNPRYIMEVDVDGDGTIDEYKAPDSSIGINEPPVADADGPYEGEEGSPITFNAGNSTDPDGDLLQYRWDFDGDGSWDTGWLETATANHTWGDDFADSATLEVSDGELTDNATALVNVSNVSPIVGDITAPLDPVEVGAEISANATFTDPGIDDTHAAIWDWGDNTTSEGYIDEAVGFVSGNHTYTATGVYTVKLTVTDDDNGSDESVFRYVVVYDPEGGFVTGGGWINSPEGAYAPDPTLTGKANLGFISRYQKGQSTPSGNTQFNFKAGDLNFHSSSYDWLVIAHHKAMYKGTGTINGEGNYGFMLTAIDEALTPSTDVDLFRIKIWDKATGEVIYDNQMGDEEDADPTTELGGGSIVIHEGE